MTSKRNASESGEPSGIEPTLASAGHAAAAIDATLPSGSGGAAAGVEATLPSGAGGASDAHAQTMATGAPAGRLAASSSPGVVVRAGRKDDYAELTTVDPQHYVIGREIARGGMGRIMMARDRRIGRDVAIKELLVASGDMRARFEREARITAKLQHPAIVNLLEAGTWPGGEPFYVMKLVTGESLDKAIASRPTLAERLGLLPNVIAAVDALAYAHRHRVIHRDLKPANVLVGEFGETVVIDWGLAKDLADQSGRDDVPAGPYRTAPSSSVETVAGEVMGTPAYMPPEQARGEAVGEAADVYSLGAMLYHVLGGSPPYTGKSVHAVLDAVLGEPPPPLDSRTPGMPPELVTIVTKAMARDAADRYASAKELADDLKKFQMGQLVGAHRYSSWQLVRRWVRRHRTPVVISFIALVVLGVSGVLSLRRIFEEQARTEAQRRSAVASRTDAEGLTTFMLGDLPAKLEPLGRLDILGDVAAKASAYYDQRVDGLSDPELARRAQARRNLGAVLVAQGKSDAALVQLRSSLAIAEALVARDPQNHDVWRDVAASHHAIGNLLLDRGELDGALAEFRAGLATTEALPRTASADGNLREQNIATLRGRIGQVLSARGDTPGALVEYRSAQAILIAQVAKDPAVAELLAQSHNDVGEALVAQGEVDGALAEFRAGAAIAEREAVKDSKNTKWKARLVIAHTRVGKILAQQGAVADAVAEYRAGLAIATSLVTRDPTNVDWKFQLNGCHRRIGKALLQQGDATAALAEYRAGLAISDAMTALDVDNADWQSAVANDHDAIGNVLLRQGNMAGALAEYRAAEDITKRLAEKDPSDQRPKKDLMACHNKVGAVAYEQRNTELAISEFTAALEIANVLAAADSTNADRQRELGAGHSNLGSALILKGDLAGALVELRAFHAIAEKLAANDPTDADRQWDLAMSHGSMGDLLLKQGKPGDALVSYRAGHSIFEALAAKDATNVDRKLGLAGSHHTIGDALVAQGDRAGAQAAYRSGLAIAKDLLASDPTHAGARDMAATLTKKLASRPGASRRR
jgi:serine/threonine protein kinase/predicted negative regulator of RcsB-dependent stress response